MTKNVEIKLDLEARSAQRELSKTAREARDLGDDLEDGETAASSLAKAIESTADEMIREIDATRKAVDRMDTALDGTDMDATKVVRDLKKIGLTAEEIEADADTLAAALRKAGDVETHAASKGFDDVGDAVGRAADESDRARDATIGFAGSAVSEMPGVGETFGPLAESASQMTEGLLEGEISAKQLGKSLLGLGAGTVAVVAITKKLEAMAAIKAFDSEQVDSYTDAIRDGDDAATALLNTITEAGKVEVRILDGSADIIPLLAEAGVTADQFATAAAGGEESLAALSEAMQTAGVDTKLAGVIMMGATDQAEKLAKSEEAAAQITKVLGTEADAAATRADRLAQRLDAAKGASDRAAQSSEDLADRLEVEADQLRDAAAAAQERLDAQRAAVDATYALRDADREFLEMLEESNEMLEENEGNLDAAREIMDDAALAAADLADSQVRVAEETATANGETLTATQRQDVWNSKMLGSAATAKGPLRQGILDYIGAVNGIPPEKVSEILALIDEGKIEEAELALETASRSRESAVTADAHTAQAEADLNAAARARTATITVRTIDPGRAGPGGSSMGMTGGPTPGSDFAPSTGSAQFHFPAGTRPEEVIAAERKYAQRNGPT
jgi:hypothetical protein